MHNIIAKVFYVNFSVASIVVRSTGVRIPITLTYSLQYGTPMEMFLSHKRNKLKGIILEEYLKSSAKKVFHNTKPKGIDDEGDEGRKHDDFYTLPPPQLMVMLAASLMSYQFPYVCKRHYSYVAKV